MKKQFLLLSLAAAALFAGCSTNEPRTPGGVPGDAVQISAKAIGSGSIDTKAPVTGTSLDGRTALVFATTENIISSFFLDFSKTYTNAYARGTMTFDDTKYVGFDKAGFGGKDGGNSLLPSDGSEIFLMAVCPEDWTISDESDGFGNTYERLSYTFDGKIDVLSTCIPNVAAPEIKIAYNHATIPDKAELPFLHLLTRSNIQVKAENADAQTAWGSVKSVTFKSATPINRVHMDKSGGPDMTIEYDQDPVNTTPVSFYKLSGTTAAPTYTDTKFEAADFAASKALSTVYDNACYSMLAPVTVDDDKTTAELTLEVVTLDKVGGVEKKTEVKVSLDQSKFADNNNYNNSTRGYTITIRLNFRTGVIQAIAMVEAWKDYGTEYEDVDVPESAVVIGDFKNNGIVYWIDPTNPKKYKVFSLDDRKYTLWSAKNTYVLGAGDGQDATDGRKNVAAMKAYSTAHTGDSDNTTQTTGIFATDFPAAAFCDAKNVDGVTGWYLPSKGELKMLSDSYMANQAAIDKTITDKMGTPIEDGGNYWSSTEYLDDDRYAWFGILSTSGQNATSKSSANYNVRCIKSN